MERHNGKARHFYDFFSAVSQLWNTQETLKLSNIRLGHMQYFFAFPLALIFVMSQHFLLQGRADIFGLKFITVGIIAFGFGATVFFPIANIKSMSTLARIASLLAFAGFLPYLFLPEGTISVICAVMLMAGIGGCVSLSSYSSGFVLNNTERFFGSALVLIFSGSVRIWNELFVVPEYIMTGLMGAVAAGLMLSSFFCRSEDFVQDYTGRGKYNAGVWLALYIFFSFFITKSFGIHFPAFQMPNSDLIKGSSIMAAVILCLIVQMVFKRSIWTLCNMFFIATIGCYTLDAMGEHALADVVYGFKETGLLIAFYLIGCVTNRFSDFKMHKRLLFIMMPAIIPIYIIPDLLSHTEFLYPASIGISAALFIVFLLLSPAYSRHLFLADWSDSLYFTDIAEAKEQVEHTEQLENLSLTPREKEIAAFLLQGAEIRKIAEKLDIKYDTVKYHIKNLYKKSGVSSRVELLIRFGAESALASKLLSAWDVNPVAGRPAAKMQDGTGWAEIPDMDGLRDFFDEQPAEGEGVGQPPKETLSLLASYNDFMRRMETLTIAERGIFDLYIRGLTVQQIADEKVISISTVKFHNRNIYAKLGIGSR
ncbi:MAG: helix-turn-helix transcriptional regulator, partial [Peptococcaceae bacterium]|nr:helix-turn-helix transcriptional regulator [Peptococcaceae bacterium]